MRRRPSAATGSGARAWTGYAEVQYEVEVNGTVKQVIVHRVDGRFSVAVDGREWSVDAIRTDASSLSLLVGTASYEVSLTRDAAAGPLVATLDGVRLLVGVDTRRRWRRKDAGTGGVGPQRMVAPMPGKVARVLVRPGDAVRPRQPLIIIEAMKMENELRATSEGVVSEVHAQEGQSVDAGALLLIVSPA